MTPRKRVVAALNHREPDRAQVDPSGYRSSGVAAMAYPRLPKYPGLESKPARVHDVIQQLASVDEDVLDCLGAHCIAMRRSFALYEDSWKPWTLPDGTSYFEQNFFRLARSNDARILTNIPPAKIVAMFDAMSAPR